MKDEEIRRAIELEAEKRESDFRYPENDVQRKLFIESDEANYFVDLYSGGFYDAWKSRQPEIDTLTRSRDSYKQKFLDAVKLVNELRDELSNSMEGNDEI